MLPTVQQIPALLVQLADPRGRCNRQGFLHVAVSFLALQVGVWALFKIAGIELSDSTLFWLNAPILWIGTAVCVKRLHDLGHKGWWIPVAFTGWVIAALVFAFIAALAFGPETIVPGTAVYTGVFALIVLPALGALLWLHTSNGMTVSNAFGPVPSEFGLSMPAFDDEHVDGGAVAA